MKNKNDANQQAEVKDTSSPEQVDVQAEVKATTETNDTETVETVETVDAQEDAQDDKEPQAETKTETSDIKSSGTIEQAQSHKAKSDSLDQEPLAPQPDKVSEPSDTKAKISKLAILCLILIFLLTAAGSWAFYTLHKAVNTEQNSIVELADNHSGDISAAKLQLEQQKTLHSSEIAQLSEAIAQKIARQQQTIVMLQDKMTELAGRRPNDWLLAEANYLVKLAGRKLWQEKDISTASTLLTTADIRIAEMNDPSLISIRQALASDIASLQALPRDNSETLALKIDGLISQVDNLKLNMIELPEVIEDQTTGQLSDSAADWQQNLKRMWHSFSDGFITVRRRSGSVEPLMSPKQQWYLEENLKSKLMQTQLAVYRQQQDAYEHSIELSSRWLMQFYDRQDSTTEFMLSELDSLKSEKVSVSYPQKLASSNLIIDELSLRNIGYDNKAGR